METTRYFKRVNHIWEERNVDIEVSYEGDKLIMIDNVFSEEECDKLISMNWEEGKNEVIFEDLSNELFRRIEKEIPKTVYEIDNDLDIKFAEWNFQEISPYWKLYKKDLGSKIRNHYDKMLIKSVDEKSMFSVLFI